MIYFAENWQKINIVSPAYGGRRSPLPPLPWIRHQSTQINHHCTA